MSVILLLLQNSILVRLTNSPAKSQTFQTSHAQRLAFHSLSQEVYARLQFLQAVSDSVGARVLAIGCRSMTLITTLSEGR